MTKGIGKERKKGESCGSYLVLLIDGAHQRSRRRKDLIDENEDGLFWGELDALADDVDELADCEVGGDKILLLVDGCDVGFFDFLADYLFEERKFSGLGKRTDGLEMCFGRERERERERERRRCEEVWLGGLTYGNAISVLLSNPLGFCLALLEGVLVLEFGTHIVV